MIPLVDLAAEHAAHGEEVERAMLSVVRSGKFILGPAVSELEDKLAARAQPDDSTKPVHCIGVGSGTAALHAALMALSLKPGDEVVTTPFTWVATAEVIALAGATPVFVDIDPRTYLLDVARLPEAVTRRTRAVIVVSLFGLVPDMRALRLALDGAESKHWTRISLIEDAAQSFGAVRGGNPSCGSPFASAAATSFFPTKPLSCLGDGGALFTQDAKIASAVSAIRVHGRDAVTGRHERIGLNSRLDTLQAAVLVSRLERLDTAIAARVAAADRYNRMLADDKRVVCPVYDDLRESDPSLVHAYAVYTVRIRERNAVAKRMKEAGVASKPYYPVCCHQQPAFVRKGEPNYRLPVAEQVAEQVLALPMHAFLEEETQTVVVKALREALDQCGVNGPPELDVDPPC